MKTAEDEAFEDIERRQGGGFKAKQAMAMDKMSPFEKWWYYEGSGPPQKGEDYEEHTKRMCEIAWSNGADVATQPAQEPVAWMCSDQSLLHKGYSPFSSSYEDAWNIPVYTAPPKREWVNLTADQIHECIENSYFHTAWSSEIDIEMLVQNIDAALQKLNT